MSSPEAMHQNAPPVCPPLPHLRGMDLLDSPLLNKGTAFTPEERVALGLDGLLPPHVESLEEQVVRAYEAFRRKTDDLERYIYLRALQDTNEVLFYRLLLDHLEEMIPVVYTPVVALGCQEFSHVYRRPRGLFVPYPLRGSIRELLAHRPCAEVDVAVVTDGERILGIGDQGVGGLGIPIGKLSLYTLIGGIPPERTLPIILDVGTNNVDRLRDPEYLGWRHERVVGTEYDLFVDEFVEAFEAELPGTLLQWEDFGVTHARPILERFRNRILTFNDDIQGTGAVVLATILSALQVVHERVRDQRIVFFGAGTAAVGVADMIRSAIVGEGETESKAAEHFCFVNRGGLVHAQRTDLKPEQAPYAPPWERVSGWTHADPNRIDLFEVVQAVRPTILIGLSTVGGAFDEMIVREMARHAARPVILALSNPTSRSEATPADLLEWTDGRALIATGSPFPPVEFRGKTYPVAQCNNAYVFPSVGLGVVASRGRRVTNEMFLAAARRLAELSPAALDPAAPLLPPLTDVRHVAVEVANAVAREAQRTGLAPFVSPERRKELVEAAQWLPRYPQYVGPA